MTIPPSNPKVLGKLLKEIEVIDAQFPSIRAGLDEADMHRREAEHTYNRIAVTYEQLRLERNKLLCELRGQDTKETMDVLSSTIYHHTHYNDVLSSRKLRELRVAGIVYIGDLAQAKMVRHRGRPLSLHPRLSDGTYREAGVPVVGKKSIVHLEAMLAKHGLTFGMTLPDWIRPIKLEELQGKVWNNDELFNMEACQLLKKLPHGGPYAFSRHHLHNDEPVILVGDLVQMSEKAILNIDYLGPKGIGYIKQTLAEHGLSLGMKLEGWVRPNIE